MITESITQAIEIIIDFFLLELQNTYKEKDHKKSGQLQRAGRHGRSEMQFQR